MKSLILFLFLFLQIFAFADEADKFLKQADDIRNPSDSFQMRVEVLTDSNSTLFDVHIKDKERTLIVTKEPVRDRGRNMLMLDRDFYAYVPNLKRSMRLSLAQKMSGQVANGDIARTRWHGDYKVVIEKQDDKEIQLLLDASKKNLTYQKIRLWLSTISKQPVRADYLSLNGQTILKTAHFESYKQLAGKLRPSVIRIVDTRGDTSKILIHEMKVSTYNDSFFTQRNMEKIK